MEPTQAMVSDYEMITGKKWFEEDSGYDPEVDTRTATPLTPNVDYSAYPKSHSWVAGVNITF